MKRSLLVRQLLTALLVLLASGIALAHVKWFIEHENQALNFSDVFAFPNLLFVVGPVLATVVAWLLWRGRDGQGFLPGPSYFGATDLRRSAIYGLVPAILGVHIAVPLFVHGVQRQLFSPEHALGLGAGSILGLVQAGIALSFFYGGFTRIFAVVLAVLWLLSPLVIGLEGALENIHYLGFALFFFLAGRGPISIDRLILPRLEPPKSLMRYAVPALRVSIGLGLIVLAFTEKFANLSLARAFLQEFPELNFSAALGLPIPDTYFVLTAGAVELTIGLFLLWGLFPREIILIAWLPFNLTLTVFNWVELVGHLPYYGALAVLLIWTPKQEDRRLWTEGLTEGPLATEELGSSRTRTAPESTSG